MLRICCPHCGPRPEEEFTWGGSSGIVRPGPWDRVSDEDWGAYLHLRDNPLGHHAETWQHSFGCLEWFCALRDTGTHEILATWILGAPGPAVARNDGEAR